MIRFIQPYDLFIEVTEKASNETKQKIKTLYAALRSCSMAALFTREDFNEFFVRLLALHQREGIDEDASGAYLAAVDGGALVHLNDLGWATGFLTQAGSLYQPNREVWLNENGLSTTVDAALLQEAERLANSISEERFTRLQREHSHEIAVLKREHREMDSVKFDIAKIPMDVLRTIVGELRGEYGFDETLLENRDADEFGFEFDLVELAWVFANGYAFPQANTFNMMAYVDSKVDFDYNKYEGLNSTDSGINVLDTYKDYELWKYAEVLEGIEMV